MAAKKKPATAAPKKASVKKKTTSGKASTRRPATSGHVLSASDVSVLEALPSAYDAGPTERLADVLQNARNAHAAFTAYAKPLVAGSKLTASTGKDLAAAMARFEAAERAWNGVRSSAPSVVEARKEGEELKAKMLSALRYFLGDDKAVMSRCDKIVEGTGDVDLADDLVKLVDLCAEHASTLAKAKIPKGAADRAATIADALTGGATKRRGTPEEIAAQRLRNRACNAMSAHVDAIFEAGRYVFQNDPKVLKLFRRVTRPARRRRGL
ncbi:MAG: hypothetical protein IPK71_26735 [Myxococcales bacterium]|nr:hypothetical protein [Myxococcales bacterium]